MRERAGRTEPVGESVPQMGEATPPLRRRLGVPARPEEDGGVGQERGDQFQQVGRGRPVGEADGPLVAAPVEVRAQLGERRPVGGHPVDRDSPVEGGALQSRELLPGLPVDPLRWPRSTSRPAHRRVTVRVTPRRRRPTSTSSGCQSTRTGALTTRSTKATGGVPGQAVRSGGPSRGSAGPPGRRRTPARRRPRTGRARRLRRLRRPQWAPGGPRVRAGTAAAPGR